MPENNSNMENNEIRPDAEKWKKGALRKEIAELEGLLERAKGYEEDIDVRWARELFRELIQQRRERLVRLEE